MRAAVVLVALLVPPLAGCVLGDPTLVEGDGERGDAPLFVRADWGMSRCELVSIEVPARSERLLPYFPKGFAVATRPGPVDGQADASVLVFLAKCRQGDYAAIRSPAIPANEIAAHDVDEHAVKWDVLVPSDAMREGLADRGFAARTGSVSLESAAGVAGVGASLRASATLDGFGALAIETAVPREAQGHAATFAEYSASTSRAAVATWKASEELASARGGVGTLTVQEGSWLADALGGASVTGQVRSGSWVVAGTLEVPN